jgi:hypothetical protein
MARQRNDAVVLIVLGLLSMSVVALINYFSNRGEDNSHTNRSLVPSNEQEHAQLLRRDRDAQQVLIRRLEEVESLAKSLQQRLQRLESVPQFQQIPSSGGAERPGSGGGSPNSMGLADGALDRGRDYIARGKYDPMLHERILSDLVNAYAVRSLSPPQNKTLLAEIQQVNTIGVKHYLDLAHELPAPSATQLLDRFLKSTPRLTPSQMNQILDAIQESKASSPN